MKKTSSNNDRGKIVRKSGTFNFDVPALVKAARSAVREAVRQHKLAGHSIAAVVDGKVVTIPASRIKA
jgi:sugar (pentulose or hexulose) kinase